jgi:hypothetical protein
MTTPLATLTAPAAPARRDDVSPVLARLGGELRVCAVLGIIALPFTVWIAIPLAGRFGLLGFVLAYLAGGAVLRAGLTLSWATGGRVLLGFLGPSGESTRRASGFSREQALVQRGDAAGAVAACEGRLAEVPGDVVARLRLAELHRAGGEPARAADLLRELRRLPGVTAEQDEAAANRLVDLYIGPLAAPGRALVELRRLADRYPSTRIGADARAAIARRKRDLSGA